MKGFYTIKKEIEDCCTIIRSKGNCFVFAGFVKNENAYYVFITSIENKRRLTDIANNKSNTEGVIFRLDKIIDGEEIIEKLKEYIKILN